MMNEYDENEERKLKMLYTHNSAKRSCQREREWKAKNFLNDVTFGGAQIRPQPASIALILTIVTG